MGNHQKYYEQNCARLLSPRAGIPLRPIRAPRPALELNGALILVPEPTVGLGHELVGGHLDTFELVGGRNESCAESNLSSLPRFEVHEDSHWWSSGLLEATQDYQPQEHHFGPAPKSGL